MKAREATPWPKMSKQNGRDDDSMQSGLQYFTHCSNATRGLLSCKTGVLSFQTRFLAGLFLCEARRLMRVQSSRAPNIFAMSDVAATSGFALRRRKFARSASFSRSALIRSLSCASFANIILRSGPWSLAADAKCGASTQAA